MAAQAAARLRRTFRYTSDDDDADKPLSAAEYLDEEEQERLIQTLARENRTRNAAFARVLFLLPALASVPYLLNLLLPLLAPLLLRPPETPSVSYPDNDNNNRLHSPLLLLSLLGLSSLAATGWLLYRLDDTETGFGALDRLARARSASSSPSSRSSSPLSPLSRFSSLSRSTGAGLPGPGSTRQARRAREERGSEGGVGGGSGGGGGGGEKSISRDNRSGDGGRSLLHTSPRGSRGGEEGAGKSPLERHLPWLNVGLAALALLTGLLQRLKTGGGGGGGGTAADSAGVNPVLLGALPGVVLAAVVGAKVSMAGVDPVRELSGLRYEYKGA